MFTALRLHRQPASLWVRAAALLSLLAVAAALFMSVAQLASDVRTGRLGGVCSAAKSAVTAVGASTALGETAQDHAHCELCGSLTLALPPIAAQHIDTQPNRLPALAAPPSQLARFGAGLPYSRGPPLFFFDLNLLA